MHDKNAGIFYVLNKMDHEDQRPSDDFYSLILIFDFYQHFWEECVILIPPMYYLKLSAFRGCSYEPG